MTNYFERARQAQKEVEQDRLNILVCGNTFTDMENPYPTVALNKHLKSLNYNSYLAEENKEDSEQHPNNLPVKLMQMASDCDIVVLLVSNIGGVATELPVMATIFPEKTIFCVKEGDNLGQMINGWLSGRQITKISYTTKEGLFDSVHEELREWKLYLRMRKLLSRKLDGTK